MNTAFEALMKDMLQNGWFTRSEGDVESPLGYFGYVTNDKSDLFELRQVFCETIGAYGDVADEDLIGNFFATITTNGIIHIFRKNTAEEAKKNFDHYCNEFAEWSSNE